MLSLLALLSLMAIAGVTLFGLSLLMQCARDLRQSTQMSAFVIVCALVVIAWSVSDPTRIAALQQLISSASALFAGLGQIVVRLSQTAFS